MKKNFEYTNNRKSLYIFIARRTFHWLNEMARCDAKGHLDGGNADVCQSRRTKKCCCYERNRERGREGGRDRERATCGGLSFPFWLMAERLQGPSFLAGSVQELPVGIFMKVSI